MISVHHFLKCSAACSVCVHVLSTRGQSVLTVNVFLQQSPDTFWELLTCQTLTRSVNAGKLTNYLYCHVLIVATVVVWP